MKQFLEPLGITLTEEQLNQFKTYYEFLVTENKKYNLTAITDEKEVYYKHFYDSVSLIKTELINDKIKLCDIGSGAGFPSIPLKIVFPLITVYIVESQTKKTNFLNALKDLLNLDNIYIINERAEIFAVTHLNHFDIVTARAVAPLNILNELCIPFVKKGGHFIAMKSSLLENELDKAKYGIITLGGQINKVISIQLPEDMGERSLLIVEKVSLVKGYPRSFALIKKKPL